MLQVKTKPNRAKPTQKRAADRSFRVSADLDDRIGQALAATGANLSELSQVMFSRYLDVVARELISSRAQAVEKFLSAGGGALRFSAAVRSAGGSPGRPSPHPTRRRGRLCGLPSGI